MKFWVRLEEWILVLLMIVICVITMINVLSRYLLNSSFSMTEELTTNLFAYIIFIGAALLARENGHLGFALLTEMCPVRMRKALLLFVACLTSLFFIIVLWYGLEMVMQQFTYQQKTPAMGLPEWVMGLSVPLGALLCLIRFWEGYLLEWKKMKQGGDAH